MWVPLDLTGTPATAGGGDFIWGGANNDLCHGGINNDTIFGGSGDDHCEGNAGNDTIYGEAGEDELIGGGYETASAGVGFPDGVDTINGGDNADVITGDNALVTDHDARVVDRHGQGSRLHERSHDHVARPRLLPDCGHIGRRLPPRERRHRRDLRPGRCRHDHR